MAEDFVFQPFEVEGPFKQFLHFTFYAKGHIGYQTEKILPTGQIPLLITLGAPHRLGKAPKVDANPSFSEGWVDGFQTTPTWHTPEDGTHVLGLAFDPIGFHALFGHDMSTLTDKTHDARTIVPKQTMDFLVQCAPEAGDPETHRNIVDHLKSLEQLEMPGWLWQLYQHICSERGEVDLDQWYEKSTYSDRHISNHFKRAVGVTPKLLCRVHRLTALLQAVDPTIEVNWTELAHQFGFYDQPHFNREFRKLSGLYPSEYLEQRRREYKDMSKGEHVAFAPQS